jgi:hypothetical protein
MATKLNGLKSVYRAVPNALVRDRGLRSLVVGIHANGTLTLRPHRTRQEEIIPLADVWSIAVKARVARQRAEKKAERKLSRR